jgi:hypothetical protein
MTGKKKSINYEGQINKAILHILQQILKDTALNGLRGEHHFYVRINTQHPLFSIQDSACNIDQNIMDRYPKEITIVLQNAFEKLEVEDTLFTVVLNFSSMPRTVVVPFSSIVAFHDPFANFAVHFDQKEAEEDESEYIEFEDYDEYTIDDDDELAKFLEYDYNVYKSSNKEKVVYLDDIRSKMKQN